MIISDHTVVSGSSTFLITRLTREKSVTTTLFNSDETFVFIVEKLVTTSAGKWYGVFTPYEVVYILLGAFPSQENFGRSRLALRFQLVFCPQPVLEVVAMVAAPVQIKFISAVLDLFRVRILFAVGA